MANDLFLPTDSAELREQIRELQRCGYSVKRCSVRHVKVGPITPSLVEVLLADKHFVPGAFARRNIPSDTLPLKANPMVILGSKSAFCSAYTATRNFFAPKSQENCRAFIAWPIFDSLAAGA